MEYNNACFFNTYRVYVVRPKGGFKALVKARGLKLFLPLLSLVLVISHSIVLIAGEVKLIYTTTPSIMLNYSKAAIEYSDIQKYGDAHGGLKYCCDGKPFYKGDNVSYYLNTNYYDGAYPDKASACIRYLSLVNYYRCNKSLQEKLDNLQDNKDLKLSPEKTLDLQVQYIFEALDAWSADTEYKVVILPSAKVMPIFAKNELPFVYDKENHILGVYLNNDIYYNAERECYMPKTF